MLWFNRKPWRVTIADDWDGQELYHGKYATYEEAKKHAEDCIKVIGPLKAEFDPEADERATITGPNNFKEFIKWQQENQITTSLVVSK